MRNTRAPPGKRQSAGRRFESRARSKDDGAFTCVRVFLCRAVSRSNVTGAPVCHVDLRRGAEDGRSDLETPNDGDIDDGGEVSASASFSAIQLSRFPERSATSELSS